MVGFLDFGDKTELRLGNLTDVQKWHVIICNQYLYRPFVAFTQWVPKIYSTLHRQLTVGIIIIGAFSDDPLALYPQLTVGIIIIGAFIDDVLALYPQLTVGIINIGAFSDDVLALYPQLTVGIINIGAFSDDVLALYPQLTVGIIIIGRRKTIRIVLFVHQLRDSLNLWWRYFQKHANSDFSPMMMFSPLSCPGALCLVVGLCIVAVDLAYPHRFSTVLEVDYDTPYDRHVIIEESHTKTKNWKKRLEEPPGLGRRILRRLSSKKEDSDRSIRGLENRGFEMDPPKSPWRYPLHRPALQSAFKRSLSQESASSGSSLAVSFLNNGDHAPVVHTDPSFRRPLSEHKPPAREASMW
ncbi:hypothetical protein J6590_047970 [Homalodisca vitripennis]|nr:hypothetical protein J6590_047970 [Homalodisca vitripennis]